MLAPGPQVSVSGSSLVFATNTPVPPASPARPHSLPLTPTPFTLCFCLSQSLYKGLGAGVGGGRGELDPNWLPLRGCDQSEARPPAGAGGTWAAAGGRAEPRAERGDRRGD